MIDFDFNIPTKILFGKNKENLIGKELKSFGINKVLLLSGKGSIKRSGLFDKVINLLKKENISWVEHSGVSSNPLLSHARSGIKIAKENNVDAVLAVGGGSVIDESKAIAVGAKADYDIWNYYTDKEVKDALPIFTIVTMAASCSFINTISVITHDENKMKTSLKTNYAYPKVSIINPELSFTISPDYIAYSGVDTISHVIEPYFTLSHGSELQDGIMESIIRSTINSTNKLLKNNKDYDAWAENIWASALAHSGLATIGVGGNRYPNHLIEHSLSALYNIAHGAGLSIVIPAWMKWNLSINIDRYKRFADKIFNQNIPEQAISSLEEWFYKINSPTKLSMVNIKENELNKIKDNIMCLAKMWKSYDDYNESIILDILKKAF